MRFSRKDVLNRFFDQVGQETIHAFSGNHQLERVVHFFLNITSEKLMNLLLHLPLRRLKVAIDSAESVNSTVRVTDIGPTSRPNISC